MSVYGVLLPTDDPRSYTFCAHRKKNPEATMLYCGAICRKFFSETGGPCFTFFAHLAKITWCYRAENGVHVDNDCSKMKTLVR